MTETSISAQMTHCVQLEHVPCPRPRLLDVTLRVEVYRNLSLCGSVSGMETNRLPPTIPINGCKVRELRIYGRHLGVEPFAQEVRISRQYLHAIESGRRRHVSPTVFGRLKEALQADTDVLVAKPA
jgi:DNA-binding XRE family transcriptional regulator